MLEIQNTLVSLDLAERFFCCDLEQCLGQCCIEGDAGATVTPDEAEKLREVLPAVWDDLSPAAQQVIREQGVSYVDEEGDLVTSIVNGRDCVFTCYAPGGMCLCAIEKAYREGRCDWRKPASCALYPVRLPEDRDFTAVNLHRWKICKCAEVLGRAIGLRAYQFLREPLVERFGRDWYDEVALTCEEYLKSTGA